MNKIIIILLVAFGLTALYYYDLDSKDQKALDSKVIKTVVKKSQTPKTDIVYYGIDISHYQGNLVEGLKKHRNLTFIIVKATEGQSYTDPMFRENWSMLKEKGFIRGAYHFYETKYPPLAQVDHFYKTLKGLGPADIAPIVDIEGGGLLKGDSAKKVQADLLLFLNAAEKKFGRKLIIYTNYEFANKYLLNPKFAEYPLWLAEYSKAKKARIPKTWEKTGLKIWQKSASNHIGSVTTDFDLYSGSLSELTR